MPARQTLEITILSCGGMSDLMSEQEAVFLNAAMPLFRNVIDFGRARPRANPRMLRAYTPNHFLSALSGEDDVLHLIAHANRSHIEVGRKSLAAVELRERAAKGLRMPKVVVSTACEFLSPNWETTLHALGVELLIAAKDPVTPANLAAFDMAYYSALLSRVRKSESTTDRAAKAFELADSHYRAIHAAGTPFAKFGMARL